jgi:hypothetical protein
MIKYMNSIRYIIFLNFVLLLLAGSQPALAADQSRYRVEIIVLSHLEHDAQPRTAQRLEDFSAALDYLTPPAEPRDANERAAGDAAETPADLADDTGDVAESGAAPGAETDPWNVVVHVPELGERMQDAWRRLRLSGPFRPLQFLAWEQGGNGPIPTLRLHDLEVVLSEDPWAASRAAQAEPAASAAQGQAPVDGADVPPPIRYYRLDGTASLTRSRFLHLSLAVELREPLYAGATPGREPPRSAGAPDAPVEPAPTSFLLHRLEQSRVVRTGRMEYFDGPVLGVLAWVTDISDTVAEEQME